jgi:hypothetical protein
MTGLQGSWYMHSPRSQNKSWLGSCYKLPHLTRPSSKSKSLQSSSCSQSTQKWRNTFHQRIKDTR